VELLFFVFIENRNNQTRNQIHQTWDSLNWQDDWGRNQEKLCGLIKFAGELVLTKGLFLNGYFI